MTQGKAMGRVLDEVVARDPDRTALIVGGLATSYAALAAAIAHAAAGLRPRRCRARLAHPARR